MPKPTAKPKRFLLDDYLWAIFVDACGGKCVACNAAGDLQRGHIHRHADGGPVSLENLMPLCAPCNGRNNKLFNMDDTRPSHWRSNFMKLVAKNLRVKPVINRVTHATAKNDKGVQGSGDQNSLRNKEVIGWEELIFEYDSELSTPLPSTPSHPLLGEVLGTVQELVRRGANWRVPTPPPKEKCQDKLKRLVQRHGSKNFLAAGFEFLSQELWFDDGGYRIDRDPWQTFADNFDMYLVDAEKRASRKVKREADERERLKSDRWATYLDAGKVTWPEMTDCDREFVDGMKNLSGEPREVNDDDYQRAKDILDRYRVFANRKKALADLISKTLNRLMGKIDANDEEKVFLYYKLRELSREVDAVKDITDPKLAEYYAEVIPLLRELDPPVNPFSR
jgi:hypothetical protein